MNAIWLRQGGESDRDFHAFTLFLENRNIEKVSEMLQKTPQHIRRVAAKNEWRARVAAYDAAMVEEARMLISRHYASFIKRQWEGNELILDKLYTVLSQRDFNSAGTRTLNELVATLTQGQKEIAELLKLNNREPVEDKSNLTINIVSAGKEGK